MKWREPLFRGIIRWHQINKFWALFALLLITATCCTRIIQQETKGALEVTYYFNSDSTLGALKYYSSIRVDKDFLYRFDGIEAITVKYIPSSLEPGKRGIILTIDDQGRTVKYPVEIVTIYPEHKIVSASVYGNDLIVNTLKYEVTLQ